MKKLFKYILADTILKRSFYASAVLLFLPIFFIAVAYRSLPPLVPLYNQLPWGAERLGETYQFFFPILLGSIFFFMNVTVSYFCYEKMPLVIRMLGITTLFISLIIFFFVIRTMLLVL